MPNQRLHTIGFFVFFALVTIGTVLLLWPFFLILALAAIATVLFYPLHKKIMAKVKNYNVAAAISTSLVVIIIALPTFIIGQILFTELINAYHHINLQEIINNRPVLSQHVPAGVATLIQNIVVNVNTFLSHLSENVAGNLSDLVTNVGTAVISIIFFVISIFFMLRDHEAIKEFVVDVAPISERHGEVIFTRLEAAVTGVVKGSFLVSLLQALISTVGFFIFQLPQPILWGVFTLLAAFVPTFGTSLAFIPAALWFIVTGHVVSGIGLLLWWLFITVGLMDNVVSPKIVGSRAKIHPFLTLLSIVGGVKLFGVFGFLFGPILMSVFITLADIYRSDVKGYTELIS
jgi:predicted PurR-regulated permease PerM